MIYRLIVLNGALQGQRITVDKTPMTLGRAPDCAVVFPDEEMASRHAVIEHRLDGPWVRDLGSMNRILVNGREVKESRLKHGDEVELGRTRFLLQAIVQAETGSRRGSRGASPFRVAAGLLIVTALAAYMAVNSRMARTISAPPIPPAGGPEDQPAAVESLAASLPVVPERSGGAAEDPSSALPSADELQSLREDLTSLRQIVQELGAQMPAVAASAGSGTAVAAPAAPPDAKASTGAGRSNDVERLFAQASEHIQGGNLAQADHLLDTIQSTAPDYLPAYEARARLFEERKMPERAMLAWMDAMDRAPDSPARNRAADALQRLEGRLASPSDQGQGLIRIATLDQRSFRHSEDVKEMRVVEVQLVAPGDEGPLQTRSAKVDVVFFDENLLTGEVERSRATVSTTPVLPEGVWVPHEPKAVTSTYVVKAGASTPPAAKAHYYGYIVRAYYGGVLQDQMARPRSLQDYVRESSSAGSPSPPLRGR